MPETLRLWAELSGHKIREFRPCGEGWIVNDCYYVTQVGGEIHEQRERRQAEASR